MAKGQERITPKSGAVGARKRAALASVPDVDVVIVGAGFSGLGAADMIERWNTSNPHSALSYVVLDGNTREGGRTETYESPTKYGYLDFGGQYLSDDEHHLQPFIHELVRRFRVPLEKVAVDESRLRVFEAASGIITSFSGAATDSPVPPVPNVDGHLTRIEGLVDTLRPFLGRPWEAPNATQLDQQSVQSWNRGEAPNSIVEELLTIGVRAAFSVEPRDISFLHFLHYGATCGSFANFELFGEDRRFKYGTIDLYRKIVNSLCPGAVQRPHEVATISQGQPADGSFVTVTTTLGKQWIAQRVIVAMSPAASMHLTFVPPQSDARTALVAGAPAGRTTKGFLIFNRAFWEPTYAGYVLSSLGPAVWMKEVTSTLDDGTVVPTLMTFIVGDEADSWAKLKPLQKRKLLVAQLARTFATPEATVEECLVKYLEKDWNNDPFAKGCPAGCFGANVLTKTVDRAPAGVALATPVGLVHFAGSETGTDWQGGYMNGAVQSGQRAASEVIGAVRRALPLPPGPGTLGFHGRGPARRAPLAAHIAKPKRKPSTTKSTATKTTKKPRQKTTKKPKPKK